MFISAINQNEERKNDIKLLDIEKYSLTIDFQKKVDKACEIMESFVRNTNNPVISCGGGKDGTAILLLDKLIGCHTKIICANPCNPLPDREEHLKNLKKFADDREWVGIRYDWDVDGVLYGDKKYPEGLKMKKLKEYQKDNDIDGVVFGIRSAESNARNINVAKNGFIYQTKDGMRCQPIADWSAEDSLCLAMIMDAPINPVYYKMDGTGGFENLHDGTWWAHGFADRSQWMKKYYPDYYDLYCQSMSIGKNSITQCKY